MPDPIQFKADFDAVARETGVSLRAARNQVIQEAARAVVRATPVRTGRLRASWFWSETFPTTARSQLGVITRAARTSAAVYASTAGSIADFDRAIYFLNGAEYAKYVEARTQFVRRTLGGAGRITGAAVRRIRTLQARFT
jgi:hypothetical protein